MHFSFAQIPAQEVRLKDLTSTPAKHPGHKHVRLHSGLSSYWLGIGLVLWAVGQLCQVRKTFVLSQRKALD